MPSLNLAEPPQHLLKRDRNRTAGEGGGWWGDDTPEFVLSQSYCEKWFQTSNHWSNISRVFITISGLLRRRLDIIGHFTFLRVICLPSAPTSYARVQTRAHEAFNFLPQRLCIRNILGLEKSMRNNGFLSTTSLQESDVCVVGGLLLLILQLGGTEPLQEKITKTERSLA